MVAPGPWPGLLLFHVEHIRAAAQYAGLELSSSQMTLLRSYGKWLANEGRGGGGIGPAESTRIERRHLADSILFASVLGSPATTWDLGTGVGLPGVPLAIMMPATRFVLIDRSGRRIDLLRRVVRILDLDNCEVVQGEIRSLEGEAETIVARASLPPRDLHEVATELLQPGGRAVVAGSWRQRPNIMGWETVEIPEYVLDQTVWLLIMRRT